MKKDESRLWKVGIISTAKDLGDVRKNISKMLTKMKFTPCMFESNYTQPPNAQIEQVCIANIRKLDYVILLIGDRYGSLLPDNATSQTMNEYNEAVKCDIPILKIVRKDVFELYNMAQHDYDEKEYNKLLQKIIRDSKKKGCETNQNELDGVIKFIGKISSQNIMINKVDDFSDLKRIEELISNFLSEPKSLMLKIVRKQVDQVNDSQTSSGLTIEEFKTICIQPNFQQENIKNGYKSVEDFIKDKAIEGKNIKITGNSGIGKSTLLKYSYLHHANEYLDDPLCCVAPLFITPSLYNIHEGDQKNLIDQLCMKCLNKSLHPCLNYINLDISIYIDSLDEYSLYLTTLDACLEYLSKFHSVILTCRSDNVGKITYPKKINGKELDLIDITEAQRSEIIDKYKATYGLNTGLTTQFKNFLSDNNIYNPFLISAIAKLVQDGVTLTNGNIGQIYSQIADERIKSISADIQNDMRNKGMRVPCDFDNTCREIVQSACWEVYRNKIVSTTTDIKSKALITKLENKYNGIDEETIRNILKSFILLGSDISIRPVEPIHMLYIEYFTADWIVSEILNDGKEFKKHFGKLAIGSQVQRFMGDIFKNFSDEDRKKAYEWYLKQYTKYKHKYELNHELDEYSQRMTHALYYIPRLIKNTYNDKLNTIIEKFLIDELNYYKNSNMYLEMIPIYIWLVQSGDINAELEYYDNILYNEEFNKLNRGCYLVYQGDLSADMLFKNIGKEDNINLLRWGKTFNSFMEHFYISNEDRHKFLRRIDLTILKTFVDAGYIIDSGMISKITDMKEHLIEYTLTDNFSRILEGKGIDRNNFMSMINSAYDDLIESIERVRMADS
ncbi:hypothetical protein A3207_09120 [Candidatus Methanomassiliicoccus intestinalis]|jgi:hypothetical protein|uniref:DUF4062 domain-containing protein n=1 Tax=Candidatus Methanomassiliicoccus intestinalis TaxID=1406512 RepID=A0A8J8PGI6_9ARCH|nr:MAG: hypothetical protein A3207_09120 [Candidatus Methanomassiliicoccus intestinalis]